MVSKKNDSKKTGSVQSDDAGNAKEASQETGAKRNGT
jgi:hypothetical protein